MTFYILSQWQTRHRKTLLYSELTDLQSIILMQVIQGNIIAPYKDLSTLVYHKCDFLLNVILLFVTMTDLKTFLYSELTDLQNVILTQAIQGNIISPHKDLFTIVYHVCDFLLNVILLFVTMTDLKTFLYSELSDLWSVILTQAIQGNIIAPDKGLFTLVYHVCYVLINVILLFVTMTDFLV